MGGRTVNSLLLGSTFFRITDATYPSLDLFLQHEGRGQYTIHALLFALSQQIERAPRTMLYSGFSHFCFWQCSASMFTGSFPVHDAPPITSFTEGFFGSPVGGAALELSAACSAADLACFVPGLGPPPRASPFFLGGIPCVYLSVQRRRPWDWNKLAVWGERKKATSIFPAGPR